MEEQDLNFKKGNPGAVQFGNFINYYQFHPPEKRISMLPKDIWNFQNCDGLYALDVGCNSGDLTASLYEYLSNLMHGEKVNILGIDIDPILIQRASEKNSSDNVSFKCFDIMTEDKDFVQKELEVFNREKFDIVFCFSITMWIHLNHGDEGLKRFLKRVSSITNMLVIEPQPWKCYKTAVKRYKLSKNEFPRFKELQFRETIETDIESIILLNSDLKKVEESERTEWGRKLLFFKKS
ncbi:probable RNA methyltransferase CG11342 [Anthonomus grandis grandis]|uniref:probable RNA methyltransferase CG11342 n=1 Tax=Anthonomus grandis grandis TaxID=2921223 RepID=UPI002165348D|nr:probable RNA methyltransferase CG11342 [Anthonomus grandis grandis]XP_050310169.1 probable RNA methyltransferase CG11342 [Anthonomus grandis grandis]